MTIVKIDTLTKEAFPPLPLGTVRPEGWLKNVLYQQAVSISGCLDTLWPDVGESAWIGGKKEGWERAPYWLDGLVPLAYLLDDPELISKVKKWMDYIFTHQKENGWLGPIKDEAYGNKYQAYDPWPVFIFLKAALQYFEASQDSQVIPGCLRFFAYLKTALLTQPLFEWSRSRWADGFYTLAKVYNLTDEKWLLDIAALMREQGYDWRQHFEEFQYPERVAHTFGQETHVVNNAMGLKEPGLWSLASQDPKDREATEQMLKTLDQYHGQITGAFSGDEHLAGQNPSQGTELCAVVEYMYSLEVLIGIVGDVSLADRLERLAFNALPATLSADMRLHQYDQQVNQVLCKRSKDNLWVNNGQDANLFGLEPNFGCCTANLHQGWPKFAAQLWRRTEDGGLAVFTYAPCYMRVPIKGTNVAASIKTEYPFKNTLEITFTADKNIEFPLHLRIPSWCEHARIHDNHGLDERGDPGTLKKITCAVEAGKEKTIHITLTPKLELPRRYHKSVGVIKGPLIYALKIEERWEQLDHPTELWEVYPESDWNFGLSNPEKIRQNINFYENPSDASQTPFSPNNYPVFARVLARKVSNWQLEKNAAGQIPENPVWEADAPEQTVTLIPYGCTHLRVTEFPCG